MREIKPVVTNYTNNEIGSGHYCECGHELTWEEYREQGLRRGNYLCLHKNRNTRRS